MTRISVAMVTYNGEKYIKEQIQSILPAMGENDELVISDDGSKDKTKEYIRDLMKTDSRIRLTEGPGLGVKRNVDCVLRACRGEYIFLADQDDIWMPEKIERVLWAFEKENCSLVVHDAVVTKEDAKTVILESFYSMKGSGAGAVKNIWRNTYMGCCMAFKRELLSAVLPIPDTIEMHDQWIGVINDLMKKKSCFIPDKLLIYRRHGNNESAMTHYGLARMLTNRWNLLRELYRRRASF